jgi:hypothetical protein
MSSKEKPKTLEDISLWYKYKTEVWPKDSPQSITVHNIMRVLRSMHNTQDLAYISTPITSSKAFYERLWLKLGNFPWSQETRKKVEKEIREDLMDDNYVVGYDFEQKLEKRIGYPIIFPADLIPARQEWEQVHFQALWLSIISEKATEVHMNKGWEYSNGCCEEFVHAMQLRLGLPEGSGLFFYNTKETEENNRERMRNIRTHDFQGRNISIDGGLRAMEKSSKWIKTTGSKAEKIDRCRKLLAETGELIEQGFYQ